MSTQSEITPGTIVELNSGGPKMTVTNINYSDSTPRKMTSCNCQWFAGKKLERGTFLANTIKVAEAKE